MRIERIVSTGQSSPPGFWYDQADDEFVVLLSGSARLRFEEGYVTLDMKPGGLACPVETMRSMRTPAVSTRRSSCSSGWRSGSAARRLPRRRRGPQALKPAGASHGLVPITPGVETSRISSESAVRISLWRR